MAFAIMTPSTFSAQLLFTAAASLTTVAFHIDVQMRAYLFFPIVLLTLSSLFSVKGEDPSVLLKGLETTTGMTCIIFLLILPRIFVLENPRISKYDKSAGKSSTFVHPSRLSASAACRIWNNPRELSFRNDMLKKAPGWEIRLSYLIRRLVKLGLLIFVDQIVISRLQALSLRGVTIFDFIPENEPILRRVVLVGFPAVTTTQISLRAFLSVSWIWANFMVLESYHIILSIIFVSIIPLDEPEDWPDLFGNLSEAYTVRRFWSHYWHRIATPTFSFWSGAFARSLGFQDRSIAAKALNAFGVFLLSGVAHAIIALQTDAGGPERDVMFFCANFMMIAVEIYVSRLVKSAIKGTQVEAFLKYQSVKVLGRVLGYLEVYAWFFWLAPRWVYPKILYSIAKVI